LAVRVRVWHNGGLAIRHTVITDLISPSCGRAGLANARAAQLERVLGVWHRAGHPIAVGVQSAAMGFHQASEGVLVAFARRPEQPALVHPLPRTDALGCQKAISPPERVVTTLRHPAGPSRGSRRTDAPSLRARAVASAISETST
jgi:hypothetical protein